MVIEWHGFSCVTIEGKGKEMRTVLLDPFAPDGKTLKRVGDAIVVLSQSLSERDRTEFVDKHPEARLIDSPGEYDIGGASITVITVDSAASRFAALLFVDGMTVVSCGGVAKTPPETFLERFDTVDVLLVPVGAGDGLGSKAAAEFVRAVEPHVTIPLRYKTPAHPSGYEPLTAFLKEMGTGVGESAPEKRARFTKDEARQSEMRVIVLDDSA